MSMRDTIRAILKQGSPVNPGLPDPLAELVLAQTAHESAYKGIPYNSNVFLTDNNTNGYKYVGSRYQERPGLMSPEGDRYGHYATVRDNIYELIDWIYRRRNEGKFPPLQTITTPEQYAHLLKNAGYYGDPEEIYLAGLKRWLIDNPVVVGVGSGVLTIAAIYLIYRVFKNAG